MKILGHINKGSWNTKYIVEIDRSEIEKVMGKYYVDKDKLPDLNTGDELNLADGYNFRNDIQSVCREMSEAMKRFSSAQETLLRFSQLVRTLPESTEKEPTP